MKKFIHTALEPLQYIFTVGYIFKIPRFQREYSWQDEHVEQFWNDLFSHFNKDDPDEYYFGTIILVDIDEKGDRFSVVDGQQRLTTSMIFLSAIRDVQLKLGFGEDAINTNNFLNADGEKNLTLSDNNKRFFIDKILLEKASDDKISALNEVDLRNKDLFNAYKLLVEKIDLEIAKEDELESKKKFLNDIRGHFLKYFVVVRTNIDSPERAYKIFETINKRGKDLTESDLVKNYVLSNIEANDLDVDKYHDLWLQLLKRVDVTKTKENDFLWYYMLAYSGPVGPENVYSLVINDYKTGEACVKLVEKLYEKASVFNKIIKPEKADWWENQKTVDNLEAFSALSAKAMYPVLMKGYDVFGNDKIQFNRFLETMLIFYFRSRTICKTGATTIRGVCNTLCKHLRDDPTITVEDIRELLTRPKDTEGPEKKDGHLAEYRDDATFEFNFKKFVASGRAAKYILIKINESVSGGAQRMSIPSPSISDVQIEHIMPETIRETSWEKVLTDRWKSTHNGNKPSKNELNDFHRNYKNRLGNLTFMNTQNQEAGNKPFKEKWDKWYRNDNVEITKKLDNWVPDWDDTTIEERQDQFARHAKKIWSLTQN